MSIRHGARVILTLTLTLILPYVYYTVTHRTAIGYWSGVLRHGGRVILTLP